MHRRVRFALVVAVLATARNSPAQAPTSPAPRWVGSLDDDYRRLLQLTGAAPLASRMIRPLARDGGPADSIRAVDAWANPWNARLGAPPSVRPFGESAGGGLVAGAADSARGRLAVGTNGIVARGSLNSALPFGANDGALWQGKGANGALTASAFVRAGVLTVRLAPTVAWSQNSAFALAPLYNPPANASPYADQWWSKRIDRPQRFGSSAYSVVDPGQSAVRVDWRALAVGAGTESMWWGPGIDNAILMTDNAAGIPHAFVGTGNPVNVGIGTVEALYTVGRLYDSDYWRSGVQPNRNRRWLSAAVGVFSPRGAPGLYLGGGRLFYEYIPAGGLGASDFLDVLQPFQKKKLATAANPDGDDQRDQMLSLFARWLFPESNFEIYGEWGRNDHSWDTRDFLLEPDHATATSLGLQKVFKQRGGFMLLHAEATSLANSRTADIRPAPTWYVHHIVLQGYTQRGQLLGAAIGPGSDAQTARLEWYRKWGSVGCEATRLRDDSDALYGVYADSGIGTNARLRHDVWLTGGVRGTLFMGPADVGVRLLRGTERNRYAVIGNDVTNWHLELSVGWRP